MCPRDGELALTKMPKRIHGQRALAYSSMLFLLRCFDRYRWGVGAKLE